MKKLLFAFALSLCGMVACKEHNNPTPTEPSTSQPKIEGVKLNPTGYAPLCATIELTTPVDTKIHLRVVGKHGSASDVLHDFSDVGTQHTIPVLGLYANYANTVELRCSDAAGKTISDTTFIIQTAELSDDLPAITINTNEAGKKEGMTFVSYLGNGSHPLPKKPFIFDEFGDVRWYLDYSSHPMLSELNYDNGIERLRNGNLYFSNADAAQAAIYEVDMMGAVLNTWSIVGYTFHHEVLEKPNGNFLVTVNKAGLGTIEDHIIEIERSSGAIIHEWDLRQSLQQTRQVWTTSTNDWAHVNAIDYDESDNTIIVSCRHQGVVKLDQNNTVVWLMAPHRDWGTAGNGIDLNTKLLQPVDAQGMPISDSVVLSGYGNHPDFEWNWCQHAVKHLPNGNISLFDNGDQRNYVTSFPYSRAVEYKVDAQKHTIQQVWQYGSERGQETFSRIVSDVDYHPDVNHFIFSPGACNSGNYYGKVIEVDHSSPKVFFEATLNMPKASQSIVTFHRTQRLLLYP